MKKIFTILLLGFLVGNVIAEDHAHHHEKKSLTLNNNKKWPVDQTMNQNMNLIHNEYNKLNTIISNKKVKSSDYNQLSEVISIATQNIVKNCKMEEKADQAFHVILGDLLAVSEDLKTPKMTKHSLEKLKQTLITYTKYFEQDFSK